MIYRGVVRNGTVILEGNVTLPEGLQVTVEPIETGSPVDEVPAPTLYDRFQNVIGKATNLPDDFAAQHDHYIHGTPKT